MYPYLFRFSPKYTSKSCIVQAVQKISLTEKVKRKTKRKDRNKVSVYPHISVHLYLQKPIHPYKCTCMSTCFTDNRYKQNKSSYIITV